MDADKTALWDREMLRRALAKTESTAGWHRSVKGAIGDSTASVDGAAFVIVWDAAESQLKAMTGEG